MLVRHLELSVLAIKTFKSMREAQLMRIWMKLELLELLKKQDSHLLVSLVLKISSDKKSQALLPNAKELVLLLEWSQVTIKLPLWLLPKSARLLMRNSVLLKIALWKDQSSMREWVVSSARHANRIVHATVIQRM